MSFICCEINEIAIQISAHCDAELADRHYLVVDGTDGRVHYLEIGSGDAVEPLAEGAIVRVAPAAMSARPADRIVAEAAAANGGIYGIEAHLRRDPSASEAFAAAHVRRLEALRRGGVGVERLPDGSWQVPADLVAQAQAFERKGSVRRPVEVELLSPVPLQRLPRLEAATWLDRQLTGADPVMLRDAGSGARSARVSLFAACG